MFDPATNAPTATTLLADSNANGIVCRHNVQPYAQFGLPQPGILPAALATYPRTNVNDAYPANQARPLSKRLSLRPKRRVHYTVTSGCPTVGTTVSIPRHYYTVDSVQFCDQADNTPDGQWRGFGTGVCQAKNDLTVHKFVSYGPFHRWDLIATAAFPSGKPWLLGAAGALTNNAGNSESINYANWYANYATRLNAAKTTSANAFTIPDHRQCSG